MYKKLYYVLPNVFSHDSYHCLWQKNSRQYSITKNAAKLTKHFTTKSVATNQVQEFKKSKNVNYKNLNIFPTRQDLLGAQKIEIKPNIVNGAYSSVKHYLDVQFKLLREDFLGPLREGISKYIDDPSTEVHENIRVYGQVYIVRNEVTNKAGYLVDLAWEVRQNDDPIDYKKLEDKQLMFGSLLIFTSDNFSTTICAIVLDSGMSFLSRGYVAVSFHDPVPENIFSKPYLMVESVAFFEPYHQVLKVLQNTEVDSLPMQEYIVDVQPKIKSPFYLTSKTHYDIFDVNKSKLSVPVLDTQKWPQAAALGLDESQMKAYQFALTREFAVIQGHAGTGKTFLGIQIATTLLSNLSLEGSPLLIICYTNHALDQFLEGILGVTSNIVRLGGQSKNPILEPYTLNNLRGNTYHKDSHLYIKKRRYLEKIFKEITNLLNKIEKYEQGLISYKFIKQYLKMNRKSLKLKDSKEDPISLWLFDHMENKTYSLKNSNNKSPPADSNKDKTNQIKPQKRLDYFKHQLRLYKEKQTEFVLDSVLDPYQLTTDQRWHLYFDIVTAMKSELVKKMNILQGKYNTCNQELDEIATLKDEEVMRTARVVGVTTTAAARRHGLLKKLNSYIVIVEEAAEVMEAHIVASLPVQCQHLILIGDHKQLRPSAAHYKLAKEYNLEISLFERMISNGIHARTLTSQKRMRPEFAELLVPTIYEKLDNHPSVLHYNDVRGMVHNLYFYSHNVFEDTTGLENVWSHRNMFEAKWCASLANYLRRMKYSCDDITIITMYTEQVALIKELGKKYPLLRGMKITSVDNFQGEESRIVILSLVRSNKDGNIGFVAADNRICVALSRAKEGLYIFGNMNILRNSSPIWKRVEEKLLVKNAIGNQLKLRCPTHHDTTIDIERSEELDIHLGQETCFRSCSNF